MVSINALRLTVPPAPASPLAATTPATVALPPASTDTLPPVTPLALVLLPAASVTSPEDVSRMRPSAVCLTAFALMMPLLRTSPA